MSVLVGGVAAFFALMGVVALARPEQVVAYFGTTSLTRDGRNEARAVYGGFGLAIAAVLFFAGRAPAFAPGILLCTAVALYGMAAGRLYSWAADGGAGKWPRVYFVVEIALATALVLAMPSR